MWNVLQVYELDKRRLLSPSRLAEGDGRQIYTVLVPGVIEAMLVLVMP